MLGADQHENALRTPELGTGASMCLPCPKSNITTLLSTYYEAIAYLALPPNSVVV